MKQHIYWIILFLIIILLGYGVKYCQENLTLVPNPNDLDPASKGIDPIPKNINPSSKKIKIPENNPKIDLIINYYDKENFENVDDIVPDPKPINPAIKPINPPLLPVEPKEAPSMDVSSGSSQFYGWGYYPIETQSKTIEPAPQVCPACQQIFVEEHKCPRKHRDKCYYCDITKNKDIDKYVLKSSVPPCPDMSQFALKSMVEPSINLDNYILKSELPYVCQSYIPDTSINVQKCKTINEYNITEHKDFNKYISKENCQKFKTSWIQDIEQWLKSFFSGSNPNFPAGYGFSPYEGYGTDNPGYALDGGYVESSSIVEDKK